MSSGWQKRQPTPADLQYAIDHDLMFAWEEIRLSHDELVNRAVMAVASARLDIAGMGLLAIRQLTNNHGSESN